MTRNRAKHERLIVKRVMIGYRRILKNFPQVLRRSRDPIWKACAALDKIRRTSNTAKG